MSTITETDRIARARKLLDARHAKRRPAAEGYLDLYDPRAEPSRSPVMALMHSPLLANVYEHWWRPGMGMLMKGVGGPSMSAEYKLAAKLIGLKPGSVVLDLACGPGNFTRRFARKAGADGLVIGYDGSPSMLNRALRESDPDARDAPVYIRGEATHLPFKPGVFDGACCFAALHMFPEPFTTLDELARVLRRGGRLTLLASYAPDGLRGIPVRVAGPLSGQRIFGREELREALEASGFAVEHQQAAGVAQVLGARKL